MSKAEVTVLMPVYNAAKFLAEAIDSILSQTFTNFEFLIIDDGSTDDSVEIINSYEDRRIRLVQNERNLGISATLNKGIEISSTELIARMDADDISYPERLEKQYNFFKEHPEYALVSSWAREVTIDKEPIHTEKFRNEYYPYFLNFECWIYHPTVMYKRSAVIDVGKYSIPHCEDYDLWCKLLRKYKIYNISEVLLDYRASDTSLCRVSKKNEYEAAHQEIVKTNIKSYTGKSLDLSDNEIECLRFNCQPMLEERKLLSIFRFFKKLLRINAAIFRNNNEKENNISLREASSLKLENTLRYFRYNLPVYDKIFFLPFFYLLKIRLLLTHKVPGLFYKRSI